ncbi:MAG: PQQ-binding-like beta-propeller repeat protein [Planctomycetes bacterium]|nr:PQQ-binding-like beta-propeller repeat protein [Planctomycetota bacterium]
MGLKGNLATSKLADVFHELSGSGSTGLLRIQAPDGARFVEIQDGSISIVARGPSRVPIGDLLLARGLISEDELKKALEAQKASGMLLGQVLMDIGAVDAEGLEAALRFQVEEEIGDLFMLRSGDYDFLANANLDAKMALGGGFMRLKLDPNQLLADFAQKKGEWQKFEERIHSQDMLFHLTDAGRELLESGEGLSEEGLILLRLCGENRSVEAMVQKGCLGRLNTNLLLMELWDAGLLEPTALESYPDVATEHLAEGRMEEADRLAQYALSVETDASRKSALQKIVDGIAKKRDLASGSQAGAARVRSEVIRRPAPQLMIQTKPSVWPKVIVVLVLLIGGGGGAYWYYFMRPKEVKVTPEEDKQYNAHLVLIEEAKARRDWMEVHNNLLKQWQNADLNKRMDVLRETFQKEIETEADRLIREIETHATSNNAAELRSIFAAVEKVWVVPLVYDRKSDLGESRKRLMAILEKVVTDEANKKIEVVSAEKTAEGRLQALINLLAELSAKNDPLLKSVDIRLRKTINEMGEKRRAAQRQLAKARLCLAANDLDDAKDAFKFVTDSYPDSALAKEADAELPKINDMQTAYNGEINVARLRINTGGDNVKFGRDSLIALLEKHPDPNNARRALEAIQKAVPEAQRAGTKADEGSAQKLLEQISLIKEADAALAQKRELIAKYPFTSAAALVKATVKVTSSPAGATVTVNGEVQPTPTPCDVSVPLAGLIRLQLEKPGYAPAHLRYQYLDKDAIFARLDRLPSVPPRILVAPDAGGLAARDGWVALAKGAILTATEAAKGSDSTVANFSAEGATPIALQRPVLTPKRPDGKLDLLAATANATILRVPLPEGKVSEVGAPKAILAGPTVAGSALHAGVLTEDGLAAFDLEKGVPLFSAKTLPGGEAGSGLGLACDGKLYFAPRADGKLYAMDVLSGETKWTADLPPKPLAPPVLSADGSAVGMAGADGKVTVWDAATGQARYSKQAAASAFGLFPCGAGLGLLTSDGMIERFSPDKDTAFDALPPIGKDAPVAPVAVDAKRVAVAQANRLHLLDLEGKVVLWTAPLDVDAAPVALAADGTTIYVATANGFLWVFKAD